MEKIAIIVLANEGTDEGLGRVFNALTAAREAKEAGDTVELVFTGAGTRWVEPLNKKDHTLHELFAATRDVLVGACGFCANAFGQTDALARCEVPLLTDFGPAMSYRKYTADGYRVLTF